MYVEWFQQKDCPQVQVTLTQKADGQQQTGKTEGKKREKKKKKKKDSKKLFQRESKHKIILVITSFFCFIVHSVTSILV